MVATNQDLKYGWIRGGKTSIPVPIGSGEVISAKSGRFMKNDGSGRAEVMSADATPWGFLESEAIAAADNDSEGKYTRNLIVDLTAVFRIPLRFESATYTTNYSAALLGKSFDLVVISTIQYADLRASGDDPVMIVGGKAASAAGANDGWIDCMINPANIAPTAIT